MTTIKDIIYNAAIYGQLDDVIDIIEIDGLSQNESGDLVSSDPSRKDTADTANRLCRCANLVLGEIASEYIPLVKTELANSLGGVIAYESLSKNLIDIVSVKQNGQSVRYKMTQDGIVAPSGRYRIEYNFLPQKYLYKDSIDYKGAVLSTRVIAYGVITEYCIISGLTDDAVMWDKRYRDALAVVGARSEKKVKQRHFA
ncbi:MAG: hypothetical protein FWD76_00445 [Firmicutes bacterium]|nr:hypothetical protein [Bacillota bacterium]